MHPNLSREGSDAETAARFRVPPSQAGPKRVFLNCHYCGYEPSVVPDSGVCPKCGGHSWERFTVSARLLPKGYR